MLLSPHESGLASLLAISVLFPEPERALFQCVDVVVGAFADKARIPVTNRGVEANIYIRLFGVILMTMMTMIMTVTMHATATVIMMWIVAICCIRICI